MITYFHTRVVSKRKSNVLEVKFKWNYLNNESKFVKQTARVGTNGRTPASDLIIKDQIIHIPKISYVDLYIYAYNVCPVKIQNFVKRTVQLTQSNNIKRQNNSKLQFCNPDCIFFLNAPINLLAFRFVFKIDYCVKLLLFYNKLLRYHPKS